ncbi:MAG: hypothetical protein ACHQRM_03935 [Bacteroidia bacterium]
MKQSPTTAMLFCILFVCQTLFAQQGQDSLLNHANRVLGKPAYFVQAGPMLNYVRRTTVEPAATVGYSAGIGTRKNITENLSLIFSVNYQHKSFENMTTTLYEPLVRDYFQMSTSAKFDEIECSVLCTTHLEYLELGAGLCPSYMIHSLLNQSVTGYPRNVTPTNARTLNNIYTKTDNPYTAYFYLTNVSPCLYVAYPFTKCLSIAYDFSFELVKNPIEPYSYIQPYQFIQNKIILILKIQPHEKNILH